MQTDDVSPTATITSEPSGVNSGTRDDDTLPAGAAAPDNASPGSKRDEAQNIKDTRLNAAMRALLAIIAGLIVGDMLKGTVATISEGAATRAEAWANALIFLAATVFVLRF